MGLFDSIGGAVSALPWMQIPKSLGGAVGRLPTVTGGNVDPTIANQDKRQKEIDDMLAKYGKAQEQSQPFRDIQLGAAQNVQGLANQIGTGPSIVDQMVQNQQNQNLQNAYALSASQRGGINPALAARAAQDQIAQGNQQILQQALPQRLQEQQQNIQSQIGAQSAAANIAQQGLDYEKMANDLMFKYISLGLTQDQAQVQANLDLARIQAGISEANAGNQTRLLGGVLSGVAGAAAGMV